MKYKKESIDWKSIGKTCKEKIRQFDFKLQHRLNVTEKTYAHMVKAREKGFISQFVSHYSLHFLGISLQSRIFFGSC